MSRAFNVMLASAMVLSLSACAPSPNAVSHTPSVQAYEAPKVTQKEFDIALKSFTVSHDEFVASTFITKGSVYPKPVQNSLLVLIFATGLDDKNKPVLNIATDIEADDWWFHGMVSLKTSTGVFNMPVDVRHRSDVVQDNSMVQERFLPTASLKKSEIQDLCKMASGEKLRVQFWPGMNSKKRAETVNWPNSGLKLLRATCLIYHGLDQGLTSPSLKDN